MSNNNESFDSFYSALAEFSNSAEDKPDFQKSIGEIKGWVNEQRKKGDEEAINKVGGAVKTAVNALENLRSGKLDDVTCGTLDIISSVATLAGGPYGVAVSAFCSIAGAIISSNKPAKPSVVQQLAKVVHSELNNFHNKLQSAKLTGLEDRVLRQENQLRAMKEEKKLHDDDLWDDYDQFMGELKSRVVISLPFKNEKNLEKDADMADFVKAVVTYCRAYICFMALLTKAKATFQEFDNSGDVIDRCDQITNHQKMIVKETLTFLSDKKYLKFVGRLQTEGGNLTKILLLTKNPQAKQLVESVRERLDLTKMAESHEVVEAVEKVSRQSVKMKLSGKTFSRGIPGITEALELMPGILSFGSATMVLFINETNFPIRIVSGTVGSRPKGNLVFQKDLDPHSHHDLMISTWTGTFSTGGYMKIAYNGKLSSVEDPNEGGDVGVIEFALSSPYAASVKINIEDKFGMKGRTEGKDAYDNMTNDEEKTLYWKKDKVHYMARAELFRSTVEQVTDWANLRKINIMPFKSKAKGTWCFIVQDFDPEQDVEEGETNLFSNLVFTTLEVPH